MQKFTKLVFVLALLCFGSIFSMEEPENETLCLQLTGIFPNELWQTILAHLFCNTKVITESSDIYEAVKKIKRQYSIISMTCILFSRIKEQLKEESIKFYRVKLNEHFLKQQQFLEQALFNGQVIWQGTEGLYPLKGEWNIASLYSYLDHKIAKFMFTNIDNGILADILSSIDESQEKVRDICLLLIFFGADVNAKDDQGNSTLNLAVKFNPELIPMFMVKGADVHARNQDGKTVLELAEKNGNTEMIALLKRY